MTALPRVRVTRYVTPLREGGSLPGIVEADDLGTYVCKFRGAGQGVRVLIAEVIAGELARRIGLRTPRLVQAELDPALARFEADEEVQDLLDASAGTNLGIDFLPGSFGYDGDAPGLSADAGRVLWLDAFIANVDRSWRNPNMLWWHGHLWVIDHGASLYFHHAWGGGSLAKPGAAERFAAQPWSVEDHVLVDHLDRIEAADTEISARLSRDDFVEILDLVPDVWLEPVPGAERPGELRAAYVDFLEARFATRAWLPSVADRPRVGEGQS